MANNLCTVQTLSALAAFAAARSIQLCLNNGDTLNCATEPQRTVDMLLDANMAALRAKYPHDAAFKQPRVAKYRTPHTADLNPVHALKLANFYNYQASDGPRYFESDAAALMRHIITNAVRILPGYSAAPWGIDGDEPGFETPAAPEPEATPEVKAQVSDLLSMLIEDHSAKATQWTRPAGAPTPSTTTPRQVKQADIQTPSGPVLLSTLVKTPTPAPKASKPTSTKPTRQTRGPF